MSCLALFIRFNESFHRNGGAIWLLERRANKSPAHSGPRQKNSVMAAARFGVVAVRTSHADEPNPMLTILKAHNSGAASGKL